MKTCKYCGHKGRRHYGWCAKATLLAALFLSACTLPQVIYVDRPSYPDAAFWNMPASQPWVVDPLPQHGSSMGFMCRDAINRGDSGASRIFC